MSNQTMIRLLAYASQHKITPEEAREKLLVAALDRWDVIVRHKSKGKPENGVQTIPCLYCKETKPSAEFTVALGRIRACLDCADKNNATLLVEPARQKTLPLPAPVFSINACTQMLMQGPEKETPLRYPHEARDAAEPYPDPPVVDSPWLERVKKELSAEGVTRPEGDTKFKAYLRQCSAEEIEPFSLWYNRHRIKLPHEEGQRAEVARVDRKKTEQTKKRIKEKVILGKGGKKSGS